MAGDAAFDMHLNVGIELTTPPEAAAQLMEANVGVELPEVSYVERPQSGWGVPVIARYSATLIPYDTRGVTQMELEVVDL